MNRPRCCYRRFQHTGENSDSAALGFGLIRAWKERIPKLLQKCSSFNAQNGYYYE